jgi:hypothetical protein
MKLIGSLTEKAYRDELVALQAHFASNPRSEKIAGAIDAISGSVGSKFVFGSIPGEAEEYFLVIVDDTYLVTIEVPRDVSIAPIVHDLFFLEDYSRQCSQREQIKLAVAQQMIG